MLIHLRHLKMVLNEIEKIHKGETVNLIIDEDKHVAFKFNSITDQAQEARIFYARNNQEPIIYSFKTIRNKE